MNIAPERSAREPAADRRRSDRAGTTQPRPGAPTTRPRETPLPVRIEWPTVALAVAIYGGFAALTWWYRALPWWVVLPLGAYLVAWHGSLQHEVVHGHPTPWAWVNELLVLPSLWLWLPFRLYRESHLRHHNDDSLTDPVADPESYYVTAARWAGLGAVGRAFLWTRNTVAGRLLLGPIHDTARLYASEAGRMIRGDGRNLRAWAWHGLGCAIVLGWVVGACRVPVPEYIALFAYPGLALTLLRSFLEHQARPAVGERTVIVESGFLFSLLYLNNNLHVLHHLRPGAPWYALPRLYRQLRADLLARNGGHVIHGYWRVLARYLLRPKECPVHQTALSDAPAG